MSILFQISKLDLRGRTYVAETQDGELLLDPTDLTKLAGGKKGLELCVAITGLAKLEPLVVHRDGKIADLLALLIALRGQARAYRLKKISRCSCGAMVKKTDRVLMLHSLGLVVGCDECTEVIVESKSDPVEEPPFRVVLEGDYEDCLENVRRTREALRRKYQDKMFRMNAQSGASFGQVVFLKTIDGLVGATMAEDYGTLYGQLKLLDFGRYKEDPDTGERIWCPCAPPSGIVTHMLAHKDEQIPILQGIVRLPIISTEGVVITERGYDLNSRVYIAPDVKIDPIPDYVSDEDVTEAKALIDHLFTDFPAAYPAAKSALIGCFFDQCVRSSLIDGPTPAYCFEAPTGGEGTGKCITSRMLTLSSKGLTRIEDLSPTYTRGGDDVTEVYPYNTVSVPTHDGTTRPVSVFYHGGKKQCLRVRTRRGFVLEGTLVHPVHMATNEGPGWRQLKDLKVGDHVAINVAPHAGNVVDLIDEDCAWFLGALVADGSLNAEKGTVPMYTKNDPRLRARVASLYEKYTGGYATEIPPSTPGDAWSLCLNGGKAAIDKLKELDAPLCLSPNKYIPRTVMQSSSKIWAAFLRGLFDGDGSVGELNFEWTTASERLSEEAQVMLAALGIWSARHSKKVQCKEWPAPRVYWRLSISGIDLDVFTHSVGLFHEEKKARLASLSIKGQEAGRNTNIDISEPSKAQAVLHEMSADHIRWDRVETIEDIGQQQVYDLCVPTSHSFVANGFVVHNTIYANVVAYLADGSTTAATIWTNNEEELTKQLLPLTESQRCVITFDNVDGFVVSATLDSAITSRVFETRRLGRNSVKDMVRVPFRASVLFTSNGATFQNSLARRMVMIQLDARQRPTCEDARGKRAYAIPNIIQHVRDPKNRARYVRAALVIAKAWIQAGRPEDSDCPTLHSFECWSDTVPAIVRFAGWPTMRRAVEAASTESNADRKEAEQFVNAWWDRYGSENIRAGQLGELAIEGGFYVPRMKVSSKGANPAYVGRSINARWMGFIRRWSVTVEGERKVQVEDGPRESGQPTWYLKTLEDDITTVAPSWEEEPLNAFDPDGQDYFSE